MFHKALGPWFRRTRRALMGVWPPVALLGLTAYCLSPAIGTGYWAEDIYYSAMIPSGPILHGTTWFAETFEAVKHSILVGRFYPITPAITASAFLLFQNVAAYKAYIVAVTVLDVALFVTLIRRLTGRKGFALFAAATTVALFQFRLTIDPILAYYGQIQWVVAAFFGSLIWLKRFLDGGRAINLAFAALAFLFCTLTYELTYTWVAVPLFLIARSRPGWRRGLALAGPFLMAVGFCGGMTALIRWSYPSNNYVHQTDFNPVKILRSMACQVSAGLPLSYYFGDPLKLFGKGRDLESWVDWLLQPGVILVFLGATALNFRSLRMSRRGPSANTAPVGDRALVGVGIMLAVLPSALTAISPFHRAYIGFGVGGIGVMVQYYGVGLLLALGIARAVSGRSVGGPFARWKCLAAASLVAGVLGVTFRANIEVATALNAPPGSDRFRQFAADHGASWHLHRMNLVAALDSGLMDNVPADSRLQLVNLYPYWHDGLYGQFFYTKQAGKRIETFPSVLPTRLPPDAPMFRVRDAVRSHKVGLVVVTPSTVSPFGTPPPPSLSGAGRVFVRHPSLRANRAAWPTLLLIGQAAGASDLKGPSRSRILRLGGELATLKVGPGWGLFALDASKAAVDPDSLRLIDDPIQVAAWLQFSEEPQARLAVDPAGPEAR